VSEARGASAFEAALRDLLDRRYHHRHPFNLRMHEGQLDRDAIRIWVRNRYYYQTRIPIKDGMILSKSPDAAFRRDWIVRIEDHDGRKAGEGGLALWLQLAEAVGLDRGEVETLEAILPGVRRAGDAYVEFVEGHDLLESVAASLTELYASEIMHVRIAAFEKHYAWIGEGGNDYFRSRTVKAPRDARGGLGFILRNAISREDQQRCLAALERKCEILWALLDAVDAAASRPRLVPFAKLRAPDARGTTTVVLPERAVEISGSGPEMIALCDGKRRGFEVAETLCARHPDVSGVEADVYDFLLGMKGAGVIEFQGAEER
jgi:pyrroloquinoline-quinone synthase